MFHAFLGEKMSSGEACKELVRKISTNTRLPYFSITPTFSVCKEHGYIKGEHFTCPEPNGDSGICEKKCDVYSRIVGYLRPISNWNDGKQEEFSQRVAFSEKKAIQGQFNN